jgi:hypothetical protein
MSEVTKRELTEEQWSRLRDWMKSYQDATDATDVGIRAGLDWTLKKLCIHKLVQEERYQAHTFVIEQSIIDECKTKFEQNFIQALWNAGFARAIYSVFVVFGFKLVDVKQ